MLLINRINPSNDATVIFTSIAVVTLSLYKEVMCIRCYRQVNL